MRKSLPCRLTLQVAKMEQYRIGPETVRLRHRAFAVDDAEALFALNSNPDVMRWTSEAPLTSLDAESWC